MQPSHHVLPTRFLAAIILGAVTLPLAFAVVASATPRHEHTRHELTRHELTRHDPTRRESRGRADHLRTCAIGRRPLIRVLPAEARWIDQGPAGIRSPMPHAIWLEARSASTGAPAGSPAEVRLDGHRLVGVVASAVRDSRGATMWITLDRPMAQRELGRQLASGSTDHALHLEGVSLALPLGSELSVPVGAVVDSGRRNWVWVETATGPEPRTIELGPKAEAYYVVAGGLRPGMRVVTDPHFLSTAELPQNLAERPDPAAARPDPWGPLPGGTAIN